MRGQYRLKLGRLVAGVRTWNTPTTLFAITEQFDLEHTYEEHRRQIMDEDYSDVTPPALLRRDNLVLPLTTIVSEANVRTLQELALWCEGFEPITEYFTVWRGRAAYDNKTVEAMSLGAPLTPSALTGSIFIGSESPFNDIDFLHSVFGVGCTFDVYYWDGSSWSTVPGLVDNTAAFTQDGNMTFTMPSDWEKTTEGGNLPSKYWIEIDFTAATTSPTWVYIRPTIPIVLLVYVSTDGGSTWGFYSAGGYYPNLWDIETARVRFQTGGLATRVELRLLEGY